MIVNENSIRLNVLTQNMLLDKGRTKKGLILPQHERVPSFFNTFADFDGDLDVVGIQEAHEDEKTRVHNGVLLATQLGVGPGHWVKHNEKPFPEATWGRSGEYMGLFGNCVEDVEAIALGDNRLALVTVFARVAFATIHPRVGLSRERRLLREHQMNNLMDALSEYDDAVVFGDLNERPGYYLKVARARRALARSGFESVFPLTDQKRPATFPIRSYANVYNMPVTLSYDDILIRGHRVKAIAAGTLGVLSVDNPAEPPREPSDHLGLWTTLEIDRTA